MRKEAKLIATSAVVFGLALLFSLVSTHASKEEPRYSNVPRATYQLEMHDVHIRVQMFPELGGIVSGGKYTFTSSGDGDRWVTIMEIANDDPDAIPCDQIRILPNGTAYVFMKDSLAISRNKGVDWKIWKTSDLGQKSLGRIKAVDLEETGAGHMEIDTFDGRPLVLETRDFGATWKAASE